MHTSYQQTHQGYSEHCHSNIDNILSNILPPPKSGILVTELSDRVPIFMPLPLNLKRLTSRLIHTRNYSQENISNFNHDLNSWTGLYRLQ